MKKKKKKPWLVKKYKRFDRVLHAERYLKLSWVKPWAAWANFEVGPALRGRLNEVPSRDPFQPEVLYVGL